jgi:hypothetical protein
MTRRRSQTTSPRYVLPIPAVQHCQIVRNIHAQPMLDKAPLLTDIIVPLLRAFREEFGAERVDRVAYRVLAEARRVLANMQ